MADDEDVLDDYELTTTNRQEVNRQEIMTTLTELGMPPEAAAGLLTTPRWVMRTVLDDLRDTYGGAEAYVTGPAGVGTALLGTPYFIYLLWRSRGRDT